MPVTYCEDCDKYIDLDCDAEHFEIHEEQQTKLAKEIEGILDATFDGGAGILDQSNKWKTNALLSLFKRELGGLMMEKKEMVISLRVNHSGVCPKCSTYIAPPFDGWCPKCKKQTIGESRK